MLGVIIVGVAVSVGITLFNANAISSNKNGIAGDLNNLGVMAREYAMKPSALAGGATNSGPSFAGFTIPTGMASTANGTYTISSAGTATGITFQGTSTTQKGANGSAVVLTDIVTFAKDSVVNTNP